MKKKKQTTAQTAAERQRKRRAKIAANPMLHHEMKAKERARWHQRVTHHKVKLVNDLSGREKRHKKE